MADRNVCPTLSGIEKKTPFLGVLGVSAVNFVGEENHWSGEAQSAIIEPMTELLEKTRRKLATLWSGFRELTGDSAYELYVARQRRKNLDCPVPSREEFYRQRMERKFNDKDNPSRCC